MLRAVCLCLVIFLVPTLAFIDEASAQQYHEVHIHSKGTLPSTVTPDPEHDVVLVSTGYFYYSCVTERQAMNIEATGYIEVMEASWDIFISPGTFEHLEPNEKAVFIVRIVVPGGIREGNLGIFRISVTTTDNLGSSDSDEDKFFIQVGKYAEEIPLPGRTIIDQDTSISVPWWGFASVGALIAIIIVSIIVIYRFSTMDRDEVSTDDRS